VPGPVEGQEIQDLTGAEAPRGAAAQTALGPAHGAMRIAVISDTHGLLDEATTLAMRDLRPCLGSACRCVPCKGEGEKGPVPCSRGSPYPPWHSSQDAVLGVTLTPLAPWESLV